jgi:magnesium chelatase accessory protein
MALIGHTASPATSCRLPGCAGMFSNSVQKIKFAPGAADSWHRCLYPFLARSISAAGAKLRGLSLDLPGHGFTDMPARSPTSQQLSLPGMAQAIHALPWVPGLSPDLVIGHSARTAIGVRMALDGLITPKLLLSINGAFLPLGGMAGQLFSPVARLMSALPFVPQLFSWRAADPAVLQRLMDGTGSKLDATGMALYGKLVSSPGHAAGALGMMANWDLPQLVQDMPRLKTPLGLVVASQADHCTPSGKPRMPILPSATRRALTTLPSLGHLAHEERPDLVVAAVIAQFGAEDALLGDS